MSEVPQGPGWWQASDGKWYAPELHPDYQPPTEAIEQPVEPTQAIEPTTAAPAAGWWMASDGNWYPPEQHPDYGAAKAAAVTTTTTTAPPTGSSPKSKVIAALVVVIAFLLGIIAFLVTRDDDTNVVADTSTTTESSSSAAGTTTTRRTTTTTTLPAGTSSLVTKAQQALIVAEDVGAGYADVAWTRPLSHPEACGQPDVDKQVPPDAIVGNDVQRAAGGALFEEVIRLYSDATVAMSAFEAGVAGLSCAEGVAYRSDGTTVPLQISGPSDVTADVGGDKALRFDVTGANSTGALVIARKGATIFVFQAVHDGTVPAAELPDLIALSKLGVSRLT